MRLPSLGGLMCLVALGACARPPTSGENQLRQANAIDLEQPPAAAVDRASRGASGREGGAEVTAGEHPKPLRDSFYGCVDSTDGSTWDMQKCIEIEFKFQDARLNNAYLALRAKQRGGEVTELRNEERRWLRDKDETCRWDAKTEGQAQRIEANECSLEATAKRAKELEARLRVRHKAS